MDSFILSKPIEIVKKTTEGTVVEKITELQVKREPTCGDFFDIKLSSLSIGNVLEVFSNCVDQPISIIKKMHVSDMKAAQEWVMGFLA